MTKSTDILLKIVLALIGIILFPIAVFVLLLVLAIILVTFII